MPGTENVNVGHSFSKQGGAASRRRSSMGLTLGSRCGDLAVGALVGAGAMGEVYSATDMHLGRDRKVQLFQP